MTAEQPPDWIERVASVAKKLGMNPVRVRWRLQRFVNERALAKRRRAQRSLHVRYEHLTCPQCTAVNDRSEKVCTACGARLHSKARQTLARLGLRAPSVASTSMLLALAITVVFGRMMIAADGGFFGFPIATLIDFGGSLPSGYDDGAWWRPATAIFLHQGIFHLGFNLLSLAVIGPQVEELYGKWLLPFLFMLTGVIASLASALHGGGVGVGASGAIMGLVGIAAGWGHRRRATPRGRNLRNDMLKWAAYCILFGFYIKADNVAHLAGFVAGGLIGFAVPPERLRQGAARHLARVLAVVGGLAAAATLVATLVPLSTQADAGRALDTREAVARSGIPHATLMRLVEQARSPLWSFDAALLGPDRDHAVELVGGVLVGIDHDLRAEDDDSPEARERRCARAVAFRDAHEAAYQAEGIALLTVRDLHASLELGCGVIAVQLTPALRDALARLPDRDGNRLLSAEP